MHFNLRESLEWGGLEEAIREASRRGAIRELLDEAWRLGRIDLMDGICQTEILGRPRHIMGHLIALAEGDIDLAHESLRKLWPGFNAQSEKMIFTEANPTYPHERFQTMLGRFVDLDRKNPNKKETNLLCPLCLGCMYREYPVRAENQLWEVLVKCRTCGLNVTLCEGEQETGINTDWRILQARAASYKAGWCFFCRQLPIYPTFQEGRHALTCQSCNGSLPTRIWGEPLGHGARASLSRTDGRVIHEGFGLTAKTLDLGSQEQ